jgi:hypothetical protein
MVGAMGLDGKPKGVEAFPESDQGRLKEAGRDISAKLAQINRGAVRGQASLGDRLTKIGRQIADEAISVVMEGAHRI